MQNTGLKVWNVYDKADGSTQFENWVFTSLRAAKEALENWAVTYYYSDHYPGPEAVEKFLKDTFFFRQLDVLAAE